MARSVRGTLVCLLLCLTGLLMAEESSETAEMWRRTILYGIDSQILEIIGKLKASADPSFTADLVTVLKESRVNAVRKAILELFREQNVKEGESAARGILEGWQDVQGDLLAQTVIYLDGLGAVGLEDTYAELMKNTDSSVSSSAIRAVGRSKNPKLVKVLFDRLDDPEFPEARKPEILLALGDLGSKEAVERLMKLVESRDTEKVWRMYAADSLGKIGDDKALPVLKGVFDEEDALLKAYAATALSHFNLPDVLDVLLQCLKEENWKVRVQAAKALAQPGAAKALPMLEFKAEFDPEKTVKTEAIRAITEIDGGDAEAFLSGLVRNAKAPLENRENALRGLWKRNPTLTLDDAKEILADKSVGLDLKPAQMVGRVLSQVDGNGLEGIYAAFLDMKDPAMRAYGIRGALRNRNDGLKERIKALSTADADSAVRVEALRCIKKLGW